MSHAPNEGPGGCVPWERYETVLRQCFSYQEALARIAESDYRGNEPTERRIAREALYPEASDA